MGPEAPLHTTLKQNVTPKRGSPPSKNSREDAMLKKDVTAHFGTQAKVAEFIKSKGVSYGRTSIVMWTDLIPFKWALFFDKYAKGLDIDVKLYQRRFEDMEWKNQ